MMRFVSALGGFLFIRGVTAGLGECVDDDVLRCFSSSPAVASAFCSQSLTWSEAVTVTVVPTITSTQVITITTNHVPPSIAAPHRRKKRGTCTKKPTLRCLRTLTTPIDDHQITSACSCIGAATTATSEITGEPTIVTITETSFAQQPVQSTSPSTWPSDAPSPTPSSSWCQASTITETMSASVIVSTVTATYISEHWSVGISSAAEPFPITVTNECSAVQVTATQTVTETAIETSLNTLTEVTEVTVSITETTTATETLWASTLSTETQVLPSLATSVFTQTATVTVAEACSMPPPSTAISVSISTETTTAVTTETQTTPGPTQTVTMTTILYSSTLSTTTTLTKTATIPTTTTKTTTSTATVMHTTIPDSGITNGAFESGSISGWGTIFQGTAPSANVTSPGAYDVGSAAYLVAGSKSSVALHQYLSCTPGKKYKLTFDAKRRPTTIPAGGWSARVTLGVPMVTLASGFNETVWSSYTNIYTCTNDLNGRFLQLIVSASLGNDVCAAWFDNFSLLPLSA